VKRYLDPTLRQAIGHKIILLSGPRQVGKTTLAKGLLPNYAYYNYDISKDANVFLRQEWDQQPPLVIFDELHKKKKWKLWLKDLYDSDRFKNQSAIITGSARLSHIKKVGDSLAGRFREYRLHPLDLKELKGHDKPERLYQKLITRGGFPEPFFAKQDDESRVWRKSHLDVILRQDLLSLEVVRDLDSLEVLIELLSTRVGSTISYNSLAEDLRVSDITVKRWLGLLEDLYVVFRVGSYAKNISRGLSKSGKYYFYDLGRVKADEAAKFENLVALSLRKELDFIEDTKGFQTKLHFLRDKDKREIDFFIWIEDHPPNLIEVKLNEDRPSKNFLYFEPMARGCRKTQLVAHLNKRYDTGSGIAIENGPRYLTHINLLE